jgi:hypothetical protein
MNLLIHDLAAAIERDATDDAQSREPSGNGRAAWIAEWQLRLSQEPIEPERDLRPLDE